MKSRRIWMLHDIRDEYNERYAKRYGLPYFLSSARFFSGLKKLSAENGLVELDTSIEDYFEHQSNRDLLTFDDGLKDHLAIARRLYELNLAAVFFIPSGVLTGSFVDSHKIQFILSVLDEEKLVLLIREYLALNSHEWTIVYNHYSVSLWKNNIWSEEMVFVTRFFRSYSDITLRRSILDDIFNSYVIKNDSNLHEEFYLSPNDISEILALGHQIGGHGVYSYNLKFETSETIREELEGSRKFLDSISMPLRFALANGGYNEEVLKISRELNYKKCYTTNDDIFLTEDSILYGRKDFTKSY